MLDIKKSLIRRAKADAKNIKDSERVLDEIRDALNDDDDVFGYTMGFVSLIDIVKVAAKNAGGSCDLHTCIWSANQVDIYKLKEMQTAGLLKNIKFLIDPSALTRKKDAVAAIYEYFGENAVRSINTHAKIVVLSGAKKKLSIISSMNFTRNPRIEQYQILHDEKIAEHSIEMIDEIFLKYGVDENFTTQAKDIFNKIRNKMEKESVMDLVF